MKHITSIVLTAITAMTATFHVVADGAEAVGSKESVPLWVYICVIALALTAVILLALFVRARGRMHASGYDQTDELTSLGNKKYMRAMFGSHTDVVRKHSCFAYIAFDAPAVAAKEGREVADKLQQFAAKAIVQASEDYDYAARIGDGVFTFCFQYRDAVHAQQKVNDLIEQLNRYIAQQLGRDVPSHAGLYALSDNKDTFETALARAKIGYQHAEEYKMNLSVCTEELLRKEASRNRLHDKLLFAIEHDQFAPFLQFIYNIEEHRFTGAEVLSRWNNPEEGFLMPAYYINDMRATGVIAKFDYYMFDKTCRLLEMWKQQGIDNLQLSCNITRITISDTEFVPTVKAIAEKYDFDHTQLILEITEDALVDNQAVAYRNIVKCKEAGFRIAIDDFGAGHSSLHDLCDYPVDAIKVDRQIVVRSTTDRGDALLQGLVNLAHSLGMEVVCEGVETEEQNNIIRKNGCDYIQGYFYSYVFPVEEGMEYYQESLKK